MKQTITLIIFLVFLSGCVKVVSENLEEESSKYNEIQDLDSSALSMSPPEGYKVFASRNQKLMFFYKEDWKCSEVVYDTRIDCYPLSRMEEEYDAGLDEDSIYYPNISFYDDSEFCSLVMDSEDILEADEEPLVYNEYGENYYGIFYKKFNDCLVKITTSPDIDTIEKLEKIIQ